MADVGRSPAAPARADLERVERALAGRFPHKMLPDLSRMRMLVDLLGHPESAFPSIHLTGTNGKTSTARMIDTLLRAFGVRTGRYTSPHLESVTERISLDGRPAAPETFVRAYDDVAPYVELVDAQSEERVTFFEVLTAMAFSAFADTPVEVGVIEVGMGGSWDATNVIDSIVEVVTPISLDHRELGDTVAQVASEKAGILRPERGDHRAPAVEAAAVLLKQAAELGTTVAREGLEFGVQSRAIALGGQLLSLRGLGGTMTSSSSRCTACIRPTTRPARWQLSKRSSEPVPPAGSTSTWCVRASRPPTRPGGWRRCAARRPSFSTAPTTRPVRRRSPRRSPRSSRLNVSSASSASSATRTSVPSSRHWSPCSARWS